MLRFAPASPTRSAARPRSVWWPSTRAQKPGSVAAGIWADEPRPCPCAEVLGRERGGWRWPPRLARALVLASTSTSTRARASQAVCFIVAQGAVQPALQCEARSRQRRTRQTAKANATGWPYGPWLLPRPGIALPTAPSAAATHRAVSPPPTRRVALVGLRRVAFTTFTRPSTLLVTKFASLAYGERCAMRGEDGSHNQPRDAPNASEKRARTATRREPTCGRSDGRLGVCEWRQSKRQRLRPPTGAPCAGASFSFARTGFSCVGVGVRASAPPAHRCGKRTSAFSPLITSRHVRVVKAHQRSYNTT